MPLNEYDEFLQTGKPADANEYSSILNKTDERQHQALRSSMGAAADADPGRRARALDLAQRSRLPVEVVERNLDMVDRRVRQEEVDFDALLTETPATAAWLTDPNNAALAKDEVPHLQRAERAVRGLTVKRDSSLVVDLGRAGLTGFNDLEASAWHLAAAYGMQPVDVAAEGIAAANKRAAELRARRPDYATEFFDTMAREGADVDTAFNRFKGSFDEFADGQILQAFKDYYAGLLGTPFQALDAVVAAIARPRGLLYATTESLAQSSPALVTGAAGAKGGAATGAALALAGGQAGPQVATPEEVVTVPAAAVTGALVGFGIGTFAGEAPVEIGAWINQQLAGRGVDVTDAAAIRQAYGDARLMADIRAEAERKGLTTAAIDSIFTVFAGRFATKPAATKLQKAGQVTTDVAVQAGGEAASEFGGQVAAKKGLEGASLGEAVTEGITSLGQSAAEVGIGATVRQAKKLATDFQEATAAQKDAQALKDLGEVAKAAQNTVKVPGRLAELIEKATGQEASSVYFQSSDWDAHWTSKGISPAEAAAKIMGDDGAGYFEAQSTGTLSVPLGQYVEQVGPTDSYEALLELARVRPDGMSLAEAQEFLDSVPEQVDALAKAAAVVEEAVTPESSAAKVREDVTGQLLAAGVERSAAESYGALYESTFRNLGQRTGQDPLALYVRYGLKVNRDLPDVLRKRAGLESIDALLDRVAAGQVPTERQARGPSLLEFLREKGGIQDQGGELRSFDAEKVDRMMRRVGERRLVNPEGLTLDDARALAVEAGYLSDVADDEETQSGINELIDAIDRELRGDAVFSPKNEDPAAMNTRLAAAELDAFLGSLGVDVRTADREQVKKLLRGEQGPADDAVADDVAKLATDGKLGAPVTELFQPGIGDEDSQVQAFYRAARRQVARAQSLGRAQAQAEPGAGRAPAAGDRSGVQGDPAGSPSAELNLGAGRAAGAERGDVEAAAELWRTIGTDSPFFRRWFGNSKIRAKDGRPVVMYHGTNFSPRFYDKTRRGDATGYSGAGLGFFLTADKSYASQHGDSVLAAYVKLERPFVLSAYKMPAFNGIDEAKAFSDQVRAAGYDGIFIPENKTAIVFDSTQVKLTENRGTFDPTDGRFLFQSEPPAKGGPKRGSIKFGADRQFNITLLQQADLSTFLHETGHFYFEVLADLAEQADAPQQLKDDYATLLSFVGAKSRADVKTEHHEQFARAFEAYLFEGNAPSAGLRGAFARFRAWLVAIYRSLTGLNVQLTDEVRRVLDRLVASEDEIREQRAAAFDPLFTDPAAAGMSPAQFAKYRMALDEARDAAEEDMARRMLAEVAREQQTWWKEERAKVRAEVELEVNSRKDYVALSLLQKGTLPDGSPAPEGFEPFKLSRASLVRAFGEEFIKRLPRPYVYTRDGGVHHDAAADALGFSSGEQLVLALANIRPRKQFIEASTDIRMREIYGDMRMDGTVGDQAMRAVHNDKRSQVLMAELQHLIENDWSQFKNVVRRVSRRAATPLAAVRERAQRTIGQKPLRHVNPITYQRAERAAARAAVEAMLAGDLDLAFTEKQKELFNHELYRAAAEARDQSDRIVQYLRRFEKAAVRGPIGKAGSDYLDQIDALLEQYELRPVSLRRLARRETLREFVARLDAEGRPHAIPHDVVEDARRVNFRDLTIEHLSGVRDAVRAIEHLAGTKYDLMLENQKRDEREVAAEVSATIIENSKVTGQSSIAPAAGMGAVRRYGKDLMAALLNTDSLVRQLDGFKDLGAVYRHLKGPIDKAMSEKLFPMDRAAGEALDRLYSVYNRKEMREMGRKQDVPELGDSLSKWEMISLALNWGNAGNREALLDSGLFKARNINEAQVRAVLNRLDKRDWDFVQSVWDYLESYWPEIAEQQRRRTGLIPEKVEAVAVETRFGVYRGGYYPIKFDRDKSIMVSEEQAEDIAKQVRAGRFAKAATRRGHTIERIGSGGRPILLDIGVLHQHVNQVIYDLALGDAVAYGVRVLHNKQVRKAFEDTGNIDAWNAMDVWLQDVAAGEMVAGDAVSQALRWVRTGTTVSALGWNIGTALIQPTGYAQTVVVLGPKYAYDGVRALLSRPWRGEASVFKQVHEQSAFMRDRADTFSKDIADALKKMKGGVLPDWIPAVGGRPLPEWVSRSFFYMIVKSQQIVDMATWLGAYRKGLDQFKVEADAVQFADRMVARAQSSGLFSDRTAVERGTLNRRSRQSEAVRIWTTLASYMIAKGNVAYERTRVTDFKSPSQVLRWSTDMVLLFTLEALLIAALRGTWPDDDDEESVPAFVLKQTANSVLGTIPFVREFAAEANGFRGGGAFGSFAGKVGKAAIQLEQGEGDLALIKALNNVGGVLLHYPSVQTNRFIDAAWRDSQGEEVAPVEYLIYRAED